MKKSTVIIVLLIGIFAFSFGGLATARSLSGPEFDQPMLITSIGQSADGQMVRVLAQRAGLSFTYDALAGAAAVAECRTLALVVGGSSKGLGAAGINPEQEEQRAQDLIANAKNAGAKIMVLHVGGEARRGELTDRFIRLAAPHANYMIVVADGNQDGIFSQIAGENIPVDYPGSVSEAGAFLKAAFR